MEIDPIQPHWTHLRNHRHKTLSVDDLPIPLQERTLMFLKPFILESITHLDFDSRRESLILANRKPHTEDPNIDTKTSVFLAHQILWWIDYDFAQKICTKDMHERQVHTHWICSCGEHVEAKRILCRNPLCETYDLYEACTGTIPIFAKRKHLA